MGGAEGGSSTVHRRTGPVTQRQANTKTDNTTGSLIDWQKLRQASR